MVVMSKNLTHIIQDRQGVKYKVVSVDEGNEPSKSLEFISGK